MRRFGTKLLAAAVLTCLAGAAGAENKFDYCLLCHGTAANGNAGIRAPKLSGVEPWYLTRQLENFASGIRGTPGGDDSGHEMGPVGMRVKQEGTLDAAVAFVGVDGSVVRFNTIYRPRRYGLRILQENREQGFVASRGGRFTDNLIAFNSGEWRGAANIGPNTAPETFSFERNFWYSLDRPERSRPQLPVSETGGSHGQDPLFTDPETGDLRLRERSPAARAGAPAFRRSGD